MKEPAQYTQDQKAKIITLLMSHNYESIDLGFNLLKEQETVDKTLFVAMMVGNCFKNMQVSSIYLGGPNHAFSGKILTFLKNTIEYHITNDPTSETNYIHEFVKGKDYIAIASILADQGFDPTPLLDKLIKREIVEEDARYMLRFLPKEEHSYLTSHAITIPENEALRIRSPKLIPYLLAFPELIKKVKTLYLRNEVLGRTHIEDLEEYFHHFPALKQVNVYYPKRGQTYDADVYYYFKHPGKFNSLESVLMKFNGKKTVYPLLWELTSNLQNHKSLKRCTLITEPSVLKLKDQFIEHLNKVLRALPNLEVLELRCIQVQIDISQLLTGTSIKDLNIRTTLAKLICPIDFSFHLEKLYLDHANSYDYPNAYQISRKSKWVTQTAFNQLKIDQFQIHSSPDIIAQKAIIAGVFPVGILRKTTSLIIKGTYEIALDDDLYQYISTTKIKELTLIGEQFDPKQLQLITGVEHLTLCVSLENIDEIAETLPVENWNLKKLTLLEGYETNMLDEPVDSLHQKLDKKAKTGLKLQANSSAEEYRKIIKETALS